MSNIYCRIGIHAWEPWEQYDWIGTATTLSLGVVMSTVNTSEHRQRRKCSICGKEQDELIRKG